MDRQKRAQIEVYSLVLPWAGFLAGVGLMIRRYPDLEPFWVKGVEVPVWLVAVGLWVGSLTAYALVHHAIGAGPQVRVHLEARRRFEAAPSRTFDHRARWTLFVVGLIAAHSVYTLLKRPFGLAAGITLAALDVAAYARWLWRNR